VVRRREGKRTDGRNADLQEKTVRRGKVKEVDAIQKEGTERTNPFKVDPPEHQWKEAGSPELRGKTGLSQSVITNVKYGPGLTSTWGKGSWTQLKV